ncbi:MAG: ABC transporter substrate-binding protein [Chthoniobacterales bacterium]|nr:ABC transporter substrate-binding protein [Chthoniobacterales bacterium]MDQ3118569.1 ABC transporter substrate-binding protein [Verrucomicrobiota bacterium]
MIQNTPSANVRIVFLSFAVAVAAAVGLAGCGGGGSADTGDTIKIGEFASLTGATASFGTASHNGAIMVIDAANGAGGVLGKKIKLITEDDQSKPGEAATAVRKLISRDRVVALIGEIASSRSLEAAPIAQQNKIPMVSPGSTNQNVTKVGDYIFRVCFIDPFQGTVMAKFTLNSLKKTRVAVLTDVRQDYSVGLSQYYKDFLTKNGGTVISEQSYSSGDQDFKAQLTSIKGANPEVVFVPGYYNEVGLIARQARELGITVPILGGDGWDSPTLTQIGGAALDNTFFSNHFSVEDQNPVIQNFVRDYRERFKKDPDGMAALGFDAAKVLLDAMTRAGSTEPAKVREALAGTVDFQGVTGKISIDPERNATKPAVVLAIKDGAFRYAETIAP